MSLADEIRQEILRYAAANPQDAYSRLGLTDMRKRGKNLVARCPFSAHADRNPSLNIGTEDDKAGLFYCFGCGIGGSIVEFYCQLRGYTRSSKEVLQELATVLGLATAPVKTKARTRPPKQDKPQDTQEDLNALAGELHDHLTPDALRFLQEQRGLSKKIIRAALLGCNGEGEYTIPVFDEAFQSVLDIRGYRPGGETKMRSLRPGHGGTRFYFPPGWHRPRAGDTLYITEGEMDCLLLADMGLLALTNTNGASSWPKEEETNTWDLSGVRVVLASDNDEAGQKRNDRLAAWAYERGADSVYVLQWPEDTPDNGFDVSDYAREYGKDALRQLLQTSLQLVPKPASEPDEIGVYTIQAFLEEDFPEPNWLISGLLPEGVSLLAGKAKVGKSQLVLNWLVALATGGYALGQIKVSQPLPVLYLALEDPPGIIQERLKDLLKGAPAPENSYIRLEWKPLHAGGADDLQHFIEKYNIRLVIVDVLKRLRPPKKPYGNIYDEDYEVIMPFKALAQQTGSSFLLVHHTTKARYEDPLDEISGSIGLSGAVDNVLVLQRSRGQADAELFLTGRSIPDAKLALRLNPVTGWELLGDAEEVQLSQARKEVLESLRAAGEPLSAKQIAEVTGKHYRNVCKLLSGLQLEGKVSVSYAGQKKLFKAI